MVANIKCHVVKNMGNPVTISTDDYWRIRNPTVSRTHLLNRITDPLKKIQILGKLLVTVNSNKGAERTLRRNRDEIRLSLMVQLLEQVTVHSSEDLLLRVLSFVQTKYVIELD